MKQGEDYRQEMTFSLEKRLTLFFDA